MKFLILFTLIYFTNGVMSRSLTKRYIADYLIANNLTFGVYKRFDYCTCLELLNNATQSLTNCTTTTTQVQQNCYSASNFNTATGTPLNITTSGVTRYYYVSNNLATWQGALADCTARGMTLSIFDAYSELTSVIPSLISSSPPSLFWTGLTIPQSTPITTLANTNLVWMNNQIMNYKSSLPFASFSTANTQFYLTVTSSSVFDFSNSQPPTTNMRYICEATSFCQTYLNSLQATATG